MKDKRDEVALSRRQCLTGGAVVLTVAAQPAVAQALAEKPLRAPLGHRRVAPSFRRLHLDK